MQDVEFMERVQLKAEVRKLRKEQEEVRQIVQTWMNYQGHDRCWYYPELFVRLAEKLGLDITVNPELPSRGQFEAGCKRYQNDEYGKQKDPYSKFIWMILILELIFVTYV